MKYDVAVSYTHLDVYKRQPQHCTVLPAHPAENNASHLQISHIFSDPVCPPTSLP